MYRKAIASIEQSTHEQLLERDCRCVRNSQKSKHSYRQTFLCHLYMPCKWREYGKCSQDVRSCRYQRDETLRTGTGSEYSKRYAESK